MAELVAKSSAVAVNSDLTTLIDWTNIESLSGFTVIVENAGGGSGNDITDVQIDTSDDGGVTSSLDQHAGVPAVPITSGNAKRGGFTETAKFVRVRALCAADEDTNATAYLLADSATGRICTLADVKDRLGITDTENDQLINRIIVNIESIFNSFTNRKLLLNSTDETYYFTGDDRQKVILPRYPVVSVASVKESYDYDFDNETALTANTDYRVMTATGSIYRIATEWCNYEDGVQVIYKGGFTAAGQTPGEGETSMPADLREMAIEQVSFIYKRKHDIGLSAQSFDGGSINKFAPMDLLPLVKSILDKYRRLGL